MLQSDALMDDSRFHPRGGCSICTFVLVSKYFCTSKASTFVLVSKLESGYAYAYAQLSKYTPNTHTHTHTHTRTILSLSLSLSLLSSEREIARNEPLQIICLSFKLSAQTRAHHLKGHQSLLDITDDVSHRKRGEGFELFEKSCCRVKQSTT